MSHRPQMRAFLCWAWGPPQQVGSSCARGRGHWKKRGSRPRGSQVPPQKLSKGGRDVHRLEGWLPPTRAAGSPSLTSRALGLG